MSLLLANNCKKCLERITCTKFKQLTADAASTQGIIARVVQHVFQIYSIAGHYQDKFRSRWVCYYKWLVLNLFFFKNALFYTFLDQSVCKLSREVGMCRAAFKMWYFDSQANKCENFVYGGCGGNANKFQSEDECKQACGNSTIQAGSPPATT